MIIKKLKSKSAGFTLVELLVVIAVMGVAVLLFTQIPLFSVSFWRQGTERLRMQRDANYAMIRIQRKLRPASLFNIVIPGPSRLNIGSESFYWQDGKLWYQNPAGTTEVVIEGDAGSQFTPSISNATVILNLTLVRENVQITLNTAVKPRN